MKKEIVIASIFIVMLISSIVNISYLGKMTDEVTRLAEMTADAMLEGDIEKAESFAVEAFCLWQSHSFYLHVVLRNSSYETGEGSLISLLSEIYTDNTGKALGMVEAVRRSMDGIADAERIRVGSIL